MKNRPNLDSINGFADGFVASKKKGTERSDSRKTKAKICIAKDATEKRVAAPRKKSGKPRNTKRKLAIDHLINLIEAKGAWKELSETWFAKLMSGDFNFFREFLNRRDGRTPTTSDVAVAGKIEIKVVYADTDEVYGDAPQASRWTAGSNGEDAPV